MRAFTFPILPPTVERILRIFLSWRERIEVREMHSHPRQPLTPRARQLRRSQTDAERKLWYMLRSRQLNGAKFRRQHPVGSYVVDFADVEDKFIIEVDGGQHNEDSAKKRDAKRTAQLRAAGFTVVRFWDNEVLADVEAVLTRIAQVLGEVKPSSSPSPDGRRES